LIRCITSSDGKSGVSRIDFAADMLRYLQRFYAALFFRRNSVESNYTATRSFVYIRTSAGTYVTWGWHARTLVHLNMSSPQSEILEPLKMPQLTAQDRHVEGYTTCECRVRDETLMERLQRCAEREIGVHGGISVHMTAFTMNVPHRFVR